MLVILLVMSVCMLMVAMVMICVHSASTCWCCCCFLRTFNRTLHVRTSQVKVEYPAAPVTRPSALVPATTPALDGLRTLPCPSLSQYFHQECHQGFLVSADARTHTYIHTHVYSHTSGDVGCGSECRPVWNLHTN